MTQAKKTYSSRRPAHRRPAHLANPLGGFLPGEKMTFCILLEVLNMTQKHVMAFPHSQMTAAKRR